MLALLTLPEEPPATSTRVDVLLVEDPSPALPGEGLPLEALAPRPSASPWAFQPHPDPGTQAEAKRRQKGARRQRQERLARGGRGV